MFAFSLKITHGLLWPKHTPVVQACTGFRSLDAAGWLYFFSYLLFLSVHYYFCSLCWIFLVFLISCFTFFHCVHFITCVGSIISLSCVDCSLLRLVRDFIQLHTGHDNGRVGLLWQTVLENSVDAMSQGCIFARFNPIGAALLESMCT